MGNKVEEIDNRMNHLGLDNQYGNKIDEKKLKKEFLDAFDSMNDDFIYIEPRLIPIIPGDDPTVINKVSEFNEDNF